PARSPIFPRPHQPTPRRRSGWPWQPDFLRVYPAPKEGEEPDMDDTAGELVVETSRLTKIYQNSQIAINDVTLGITPGTVLGLLGPNGAGKTTLLRLI